MSFCKTALRARSFWQRSTSSLVIASLLLAPLPLQAQDAGPAVVTPLPSEGGQGSPRLDIAANGTPVVKIATPNAGGTSYNRYTDFNVDARGLILNNSSRIVLTQLGGYIDGNGNLRTTGPAGLIINEVVGNNPSSLAGYIEIAGTPAQLVLANANGITCAGCGFLNTSWATLAAANPRLNSAGGLSGFGAGIGNVRIDGTGLDASGARLDLYARAITLNAGIWASNINASFGAGETGLGADGSIVVTGQSAAAPNPPLFGLDVAALGGMYANSIRLIGTEDGLGVNVAGNLASLEGGLSLDAKGRVSIGGQLTSSATADIRTTGTLGGAGTIYGNGAVSINAGTIASSGLIAGGGDVSLGAATINSNATIAAGLARDGTLTRTGNLSIAATGPVALSGVAAAHDAMQINAADISLSGEVSGTSIGISGTTIANTGNIRTSGAIGINGSSLTNGGLIAGQTVNISLASNLTNANGLIQSAGALTIGAGSLDNKDGEIEAAGSATINTASLINDRGRLIVTGPGNLDLASSGNISSANGLIGGNGDVNVRAASVNVSGADGAIVAGRNLGITSSAIGIDDGAALRAGGDARLIATNALSANAGTIEAGGLLDVDATTVTAANGSLLAGSSLALDAGSLTNGASEIIAYDANGSADVRISGALDNAGLLAFNMAGATVEAGSLSNSGELIHAGTGQLTLGATAGFTNSGRIASNGQAAINATSFSNSGSLGIARDIIINSSALTTNSGSIASGGAFDITAGQFAGAGGQIEAATAFSINAGQIDLGSGRYVLTGTGTLSLTASGSLTANAAELGSNGGIAITARDVALGGSEASAVGTIQIHSTTGPISLGTGGLLATGGGIDLTATSTIDARGATLSTAGLASLSGSSINLDDGTLEADRFILGAPTLSLRRARLRQTGSADFTLTSSGTVDYSGGEIYAAGQNFTLSAANIINEGGAILHGGSGLLDISGTGIIDNDGGRIATNGALALDAVTVSNQGGIITANGNAQVAASGAIDNAGGTIASGVGLNLSAPTLINTGGSIETSGLLALSANNFAGADGRILASGTNGDLRVTVTGAIDGSGVMASGGNAQIEAASIRVGSAGRLSAVGTLGATALNGDVLIDGGIIDAANINLLATNGAIRTGQDGLILAQNAFTANARHLGFDGGIAQAQTINLTADSFSNASGLINALGSANITISDLLDNDDGAIFGNALVIRSDTLTNANGAIAGTGTTLLDIEIAGALDNSDGVISGNGAVRLVSGSAINDGGLIAAKGALDIMSATNLSNLAGQIAADGNINIDAAAITNDGGNIDGLSSITTRSGSIANGNGAIIARGGTGLDIESGSHGALTITNGADGLIGSSATLAINAASLTNAGTILGDDADVTATTLTNSGLIHGTNLIINAPTLTNSGEIGAGDTLTIHASNADNRGGHLVGGTTGLTLIAPQILNDGGVLGASSAVAIAATNLDNGTGTIASGAALTIDTETLDNAGGGEIWSDTDATITATTSLANRGSIAAQNTLAVTTPLLDNGSGPAAGILAGGNGVELDFASGSLGRVISGADIDLTLAGDYSNAAGQSLISFGTITLNLGGNFSNEGRVEALDAINVTTGGNISNAASGEIVADIVNLNANGTLTNDGLINGRDVSVIGNNVTNHGQIFGDDVLVRGITALTNEGADAVIAARSGLVTLESGGAIVNRDSAFVYSLGDIRIGGLNGVGQAASLTNASATIQAQHNIALAAASIINQRSQVSFGTTTYTTYEDGPCCEQQWPGAIIWSQYTNTITETSLLTDSGAGRIVAGGNIAIAANAFENQYSTLAAGGNLIFNGTGLSSTTASGSQGSFTNVGLVGTRTTERSYEAERWICVLNGGGFCAAYDTQSSFSTYAPVTETITVAPAIVSAGGAVSIDALTIDNVTTAGGSAGVGAFSASAGTATGGSVGTGTPTQSSSGAGTLTGPNAIAGSGVSGVDLVTVNVSGLGVTGSGTATANAAAFGFALVPLSGQPTGAPSGLVLDLGGLFRYADPSASYLVETNPAFTNYGRFLSSNYFLSALGYDPTRTMRRLGDALYEQQLITNQLTAQAGVGRLAGYANNDAQYRALMDAGVTFMKAFGLALGVGLSAEQMATLTSDIVLLVEVEVDTPNGKVKVLAPRVYLAQINRRDLTSGGAIIAGNDLRLRGADALNNAGVMRASATADISGGNILNTGRMDLGQRASVRADNDLINRGGTITGGDVALVAGRDLRLESATTTTRTATAYDFGKKNYGTSSATTTTNQGSLVDVTGNLTLVAGRQIEIKGSTVNVGQNLFAYGKDGIAIVSAVDSSQSQSAGRSGSTRFTNSSSSTTNILSNVNVGGNATLVTDGTLDVKGANVVTGGALVADAAKINVEAVVDSSSAASSTIKKTSGLLSSKKVTTTSDVTDQTVISSTLSGDTVSLRSSGDTNILGSNVVATNGVNIAAGGNVTIGTVVATDTSDQSQKVKKSGVSFGNGGLFAGVAKSSSETSTTAVTNTGSLVGASNGDVTIVAGDKLTVNGSTVAASGDTTLVGKAVEISHATDTVDTKSTSKSSSFGVTIGVQSPALSSATNALDAAKIAGSAPNDRTKAVAGLAGGLGAVNAVDAAKDVADTLKAGKGDLGVTVSASLGISKSSSSSNSHDETVIGSNVSGNNVTILATGAGKEGTINVTGSDVTATNNLALAANGPITIAAATETDTIDGKSKSSGASIGISAGIGLSKDAKGASSAGFQAPTITVGVQGSKSSYSGTDVTNRESVLSAGGTASVTTPDKLTIDGSVLSGNRVEVDVGALAVASRQDTSTFTSKDKSFGASVSYQIGGSVSAQGNLAKGSQQGDFASVKDQAGIVAGAGGFDINVSGNTDLKGAILASDSDASKNFLTTGTLTVSDIENKENYKAKSTSLGVGLGEIGVDGKNRPTSDGSGQRIPGINTPLGNLTATPPIALSASGGQQGTTNSAIAPGTITITSGDAASQNAADTVSRDTASANAGALSQEFDDAKRAEIDQAFGAARILAAETTTFFARRAAEEAEKKAEAKALEKQLVEAGAIQVDAQGNAVRDAQGNLIAIGTPSAEIAQAIAASNAANSEASRINSQWGSGSAARIIATALNGAAGSNVTGSLGSLVQASAVNVLQALTVNEVKQLADSLGKDRDGDLRGDGGTVTSETVRAVLQSIVGCAGAAAGGSGNCGSAAMGAAVSVVLNALITAPDRNEGDELTLEEQQAQTNLVATIVGAIALGAGIDVSSAVNAATLETENNRVGRSGADFVPCAPNGPCGAPQYADWKSAGGDYAKEWALWEKALGCDDADPACAAQIAQSLSNYFGQSGSGDKKTKAAIVAEGKAELQRTRARDQLTSAISSAKGEELSGEDMMAQMVLQGYVPAGAANLPFAEFASQYSAQLSRFVTQTGKRPNPAAIGGLALGGLIAVVAGNLMGPADQQPPLPGTTPHTPDPRGNTSSTPIATGQNTQNPGLQPIDPSVINPPAIGTTIPEPPQALPGYVPAPPEQGTILMNGMGTHNGIPITADPVKIRPQIIDRGWTDQAIQDVIARGPTGTATDDRRPSISPDTVRGESATVYGGPGNYVIVNDRTGAIVQVSGRNDPAWADDSRIRWNPPPPPPPQNPGK